MLRLLSGRKGFYMGYTNQRNMEDENSERFFDDLIFPRKKTLTDLWRGEWEKEYNHKKEKF